MFVYDMCVLGMLYGCVVWLLYVGYDSGLFVGMLLLDVDCVLVVDVFGFVVVVVFGDFVGVVVECEE